MKYIVKLFVLVLALMLPLQAMASVTIGINYPKTGPYSIEGLDQIRAAQLAVEEINAKGGILGQQVVLVEKDSQSKKDVSIKNVTDLIKNDGAQMVFGGSSSAVAIAAGEVCRQNKKLFFGTLTYSNATTGKAGHKYIFRECYNAWMGAKAISKYLKKNFSGKKYYYITADYTWGWSTEESVRHFSGTNDTKKHPGTKTPFPGAKGKDFKQALMKAKAANPDVLVLVLFGKDMTKAVRIATQMGLKKKMQIVVPNLTLGMAEGGGPKNMEGVIGATPWTWNIPFKYAHVRGKQFVNDFAAKYQRYPSTSGASAYTILHQYKDAVERAGSFDTDKVIKALEGHTYKVLKDNQKWRDFDHQSIQTVWAVKIKSEKEIMANKYKQDYFYMISSISGEEAARTKAEWDAVRKKAGKPTTLEW